MLDVVTKNVNDMFDVLSSPMHKCVIYRAVFINLAPINKPQALIIQFKIVPRSFCTTTMDATRAHSNPLHD